ncbi:MAG: sulfite exporter TauE/SafE family protein [Methanoregula sp.]|uniref:sulfite exporter TauE/SafE family protein n=1 Tax=Methanoregula sp. TaxID=2052170 RepID=UPI0025FEA67D|nr:sulfite exporter TauE/SafE family protein [Methanoregula sp.]MCK9632776.1 sulfite exporter TauE/SafE family protein [Methanoregula sp.]
MFETIFAFFIAAGIGLIASIIGMGGGFLYVPTLTLIFNFDPKMAVGTSLAVMVFSSCAATIVYRQQKKVLVTLAAFLVLPAMIFSALGSLITMYFDARILVVLFALVLILMSLQMLVPRLCIVPAITWGPSFSVNPSGTGQREPLRISCLHLVVWGAMGGLVSGITGTSGGAFFVPALVAIGIPVHFAVATSLLAIIPTSITGASTHAVLGHISLPFLIVYGAGAAIGAYVGASIAPRIHADHIKKGFGILLIVIALIMIQQKVLGG